MILPVNSKILTAALIAKYLPIAFPPTVTAATILVKIIDKIICQEGSFEPFIICEISIMTIVKALPLTIPDISPITSLQKLANLSAFLWIITASRAPITFSAAIACNGDSLTAVEAIPNISNIIPIITIVNTIIKPKTQLTLLNMVEDMLEKIAANTKVITAIVKLNFKELFHLSFIVLIIP